MHLRWTLQAAEDLEAIGKFIERDSPTYARQVVEGLFEAAGGILSFPDIGRVVPERGDPHIREIQRPPYRIIYRRGPDLIEILTIHHSARLFPAQLPGGAV
jgi:plasmid stabilization system protein ParE